MTFLSPFLLQFSSFWGRVDELSVVSESDASGCYDASCMLVQHWFQHFLPANVFTPDWIQREVENGLGLEVCLVLILALLKCLSLPACFALWWVSGKRDESQVSSERIATLVEYPWCRTPPVSWLPWQKPPSISRNDQLGLFKEWSAETLQATFGALNCPQLRGREKPMAESHWGKASHGFLKWAS